MGIFSHILGIFDGYFRQLNAISQTVHSETQLQTSSLKYFRDSSQESLIQRKVDKLQRRTCMTETDEVSTIAFSPWLFTVPSPLLPVMCCCGHCSLTFARVCVAVAFVAVLRGFVAQIVTKADLETASKGLDNANKRPTKEQLKFVETTKDRY